MKSGIENEHLRFIWHNVQTSFDTHDVSAGVKRCEAAAEFKFGEDFIREKNALEEVRSSVDHAMTDSFDLAHVRNDSCFGIRKNIDDRSHGDGVIGQGKFLFELLTVFTASVFDLTVDTDTLADTLCEYRFGSGVEKLILK